MEKKEARIRCSGCGTSYKLKIPVTDKPVSFKCKKCGKVLKLQIKSIPPAEVPASEASSQAPAPSAYEAPSPPEFETTQLPDEVDFQDAAAAALVRQATFVESHQFASAADAAGQPEEKGRRWLVLSADLIKGPFTDSEIVLMIQDREIVAGTSLRLGDRPWIQAAEIGQFRDLFGVHEPARGKPGADSLSLLDEADLESKAVDPVGPRFYQQLSSVLSYPIGRGKPIAPAIFFGIALTLSTALSLDFLVGLALNVIGWVLLYGYLAGVMKESTESPNNPPPSWNFSGAKEMGASGVRVLAVLTVYGLLPVGICLVLMIAFFLNSMLVPGYVFIALTVLVFAISMFLVPAALVILGTSHRIGVALNPSRIMAVVKRGGQPYRMLAAFSVAIGLACMTATIAAVLLTDIPGAGFVMAGIVMALVLSYAHFLWFHVLGRFSTENRLLMSQVLVAA